jgi:hypothetical protein
MLNKTNLCKLDHLLKVQGDNFNEILERNLFKLKYTLDRQAA